MCLGAIQSTLGFVYVFGNFSFYPQENLIFWCFKMYFHDTKIFYLDSPCLKTSMVVFHIFLELWRCFLMFKTKLVFYGIVLYWQEFFRKSWNRDLILFFQKSATLGIYTSSRSYRRTGYKSIARFHSHRSELHRSNVKVRKTKFPANYLASISCKIVVFWQKNVTTTM